MELFAKQRCRNPGFKPAKAQPEKARSQGIVALSEYDMAYFINESAVLLDEIRNCQTLNEARDSLNKLVLKLRVQNSMLESTKWGTGIYRTRDCARTMLCLLSERSDKETSFSVTKALWDLARGRSRPDLQPGFYAEIIHIVWGLEVRTKDQSLEESSLINDNLSGREAALARSDELDYLWSHVEKCMGRFEHGLSEETIARRARRRQHVQKKLGGTENDWENWKWQVANVGKDPDTLKELVHLNPEELENITKTCLNRIPFGVTPYYLSLMDYEANPRDRAVRAQVFPPKKYVTEMTNNRSQSGESLDFMNERDTSPIDLVTRRYPGIVILKPYNTCPQICVYCQRNWEIDQVLAPDAMAPWDKIEEAIRWIGEHPAIHEVLVTGGDPLLQENEQLGRILDLIAALPTISRIRIGTRTLVTLPMRITEELADLLGSYRIPGRREVAVVTHVEHPYEVTPEITVAVDRLRRQGISVYNQLVYTFHVSRRFEGSLLRTLLRRVGIDPYYTFLPKGKSETDDYRVPLSRLLQEQKEEMRLLPGLSRMDHAVYNVPRQGKNYVRATRHRDLLTILPDGTRMYEFHPWEKNISVQESYIGEVIPIYSYLTRLEAIGEDPADYESIWYYY